MLRHTRAEQDIFPASPRPAYVLWIGPETTPLPGPYLWEDFMKKLLGLALGVVLFALSLIFSLKVCRAAPAMAQERQAQEKSADDNATALTIYNQNFFVAREHVPLDLQPGVNEAHYTGVAAHLEPDSVILRDP